MGFMAATFQRKQFPLRCAHSSRDRFFSLPGSPLRCDRKSECALERWRRLSCRHMKILATKASLLASDPEEALERL
ncbi:hypothetical protein BMD22_12620 [Burkholderia multivorans]|nr:hypothetical protein BMD22_12620 [Burkholderia multivorans]